jgi:putative transposase
MFSWKESSRKSIRLPGYDYSTPGMYYVTICTQNREHWFGRVVCSPVNVGVDLCVDPPINNASVALSPIGKIADYYLKSIPNKFPNVRVDEHVVMPNHVHFVVEFMDATEGEGSTQRSTPTADVPGVIRWFKTVVHNEFFRIETANNTGYIGKLWQRNYYEHIVRGMDDLERIRAYIRENPKNWSNDEQYSPGG